MSTALMIDNWLLQDLGQCLIDGLDDATATEISIDSRRRSHAFKDVPMSGIQLEALLGFITDVILRDAILVDQEFVNTWSGNKEAFDSVSRIGLLRPVEFLARSNELLEPTKCIVEDLCVTPTLRKAHAQNERSWSENRNVENPYLSQVIWGTAGMLSRSHVFEVPYTGHPLRRRLLEQTIGSESCRDVVRETVNWTLSQRMRVFEGDVGDRQIRRSVLALPLVAIDAINEANSVQQLIPVAVQLRSKHQKLREWLKIVQGAIDTENPQGLLKYKRTLSAVARDIDREVGKSNDLSVSLSLGMSGFGASLKVLTLDNVLKKFGIRAVLSKHVFSSKGETAIRKLLRMFGVERSTVGVQSLKYLRAHMGVSFRGKNT